MTVSFIGEAFKATQIISLQWILVQCVTKFVLSKKSSSNDEIKFSYREHGVQEMILCPHDLRSIEYIEDICCQVITV